MKWALYVLAAGAIASGALAFAATHAKKAELSRAAMAPVREAR